MAENMYLTSSVATGEEFAALLIHWQEALTMVDGGRIQDAKTLIALLWYERRMSQALRHVGRA